MKKAKNDSSSMLITDTIDLTKFAEKSQEISIVLHQCDNEMRQKKVKFDVEEDFKQM